LPHAQAQDIPVFNAGSRAAYDWSLAAAQQSDGQKAQSLQNELFRGMRVV
jgi:hypothetical protein